MLQLGAVGILGVAMGIKIHCSSFIFKQTKVKKYETL